MQEALDAVICKR